MQPDSVTQRWVIDSIEENVASIEVDGATMITVPLWILPRAVYQGLVLTVRHDIAAESGRTSVSFTVDDVATRDAFAASARQVQKGVKQSNDPGGNISF